MAGVGQVCDGCGGVYRFDTSIPSVLWNRVMRADGVEQAELLCIACITRVFVRSGESFTAELFGDGFSGIAIEVQINSEPAQDAALIQQENNELRAELRRVSYSPERQELMAEIKSALAHGRTDVHHYKKLRQIHERLLERCLAALAP